MHYSMKKAEKAVQAARQTAQNTRIVVKTTAKAVTHAIKALMEATKGSFNIKYPRQPNGITDPEYSISCGVQEIKSCLERAGVKNPLDMENIKLALQSYNYGNGYLEWAKARGGYTLANAAEFSDMMAQRMGWNSYGDKQYVPHVLQYYAFGRIPTGIGNQAIVQVAGKEKAEQPTGVGMDLEAELSGVPALCHGVQTRVVISRVELFQNSLFVRKV
jgi:hypothetical protein